MGLSYNLLQKQNPMPSTLPTHPNIKRQLKARRVQVTRYVGDGGIDAHGELVTGSGIVRIPTGVQVKRHHNNVQRSDIDRFIGALSGQYSEGIFITTAGYARQAIAKAGQSIPRVSPINGDQVVTIMLRHRLGVADMATIEDRLDENYFAAFEQQTRLVLQTIREHREGYQIDSQAETTLQSSVEVRPEDDLISLRALSYALRIDTTTIRRWIESGKLLPDRSLFTPSQEGFFFRRDKIDALRKQFTLQSGSDNSSEWRQEFLDFARSRNLTKSYKPVLIKALFKLANRDGEVSIRLLTQEFRAFYIKRELDGLPVERSASPMNAPQQVSDARIMKLITDHPLERFLIKGFLEYLPQEGIVRFVPRLWNDLRYYEVAEVLQQADEQLRYYYSR